jgi:CNT family concentrative nucleoside transporter
MSWLVGLFARIFTRLFRTSGAESLSASSNIFVGVESVLTIRPYLADMTRSELCTVLTAGMATIASSVMALYVFILGSAFPSIAGHLVSASILSAPAALIFSKLLVPETGTPATLGIDVKPATDRYASGMDAIIQGAMSGVRLVVGVSALLLALLGLVALADLGLGFAGGLLNGWFGWSVDWSIRSLAGVVFYPFTLAIGVPPDDARAVASVIGERVVLTEVASYQDLKALIESGGLAHARSAVITAYALCGFAHVASLAIFVGGAAAVAPGRTADLASVGWRALVAATLACLMTGAVAGAMYTGHHLLVAP